MELSQVTARGQLRRLTGMYSKDLWQMLCRYQLVSGRSGAQPGQHTADERGKQGHRPVTLPGCVSAMDVSGIAVNTSLSMCSPKTLTSQRPL